MTAHGPDTNRLGPAEMDFIEARDGFYMATVSETGRAEILEGEGAKEALNRLTLPGYPAMIERAVIIHLETRVV